MQDLSTALNLFTYPFMQRALIGGVLTGLTGGILGSFTVVRQLSFFSDALGHSALLGISLGVVFGLNPSLVVLPFALLFAVGVTYLIEKTDIWTDALLNIVYSSSLAISIIVLSLEGTYQTGINNLLFGDILGVLPGDLLISGLLLLLSSLFVGLTLRTQVLLTLNEDLAIARGIHVFAHRIAFMMLLSLVVATAISSLGVLLVGAFVVIPACAARLFSRNFSSYLILSAVLGAASAAAGIFFSALFNLPTGPSIVIAQLSLFLLATGKKQWLDS
ncbi:metal ABC transporter permease [cf. Phormidesmis sp. LEGE 11477]|uniref:metal ABC transporter permease n=1 Tax=cf. Phormidesmis sp. LEGE 11477 TaxID=1828680 RepID=UPI0018825042|nr:metal ABC transporter permease [cf. Phormidesmis sp. LEGE 11477]MBE9062817.1 metal ABC transporter permease [cf. Phormidesmis sp. LEGE 11477]